MNRLNKFCGYEFKKKLLDAYIIDSYEYFLSSIYKLRSAEFSLKVLENIYNEGNEVIKVNQKNMIKQNYNNKKSFMNFDDGIINCFGIRTDKYFMYNKLYNDIYSNLHSFFDIIAQFINISYLKEEAIEPEFLSMKYLCKKANNKEFEFLIKNLQKEEQYKYIEDINNISKHRFQIFVNLTYDIFNGDYNVNIPSFSKGKNIYDEKDLLEKTKQCLDFCIEFLNEVLTNILELLNENKNFKINRIYNPKMNIKYDNMDKIKECMYYVELDKDNLLTEYSILLKYDDLVNKKIEIKSCQYEVIAVKDIRTEKIIGVLQMKGNKNDSRDPNKFTKYKLIKENFNKILENDIYNKNKKYDSRFIVVTTNKMN